VEQLEKSVPGRNVQLSKPLCEDRIAAIAAGDIEPIQFDYEKVERWIAIKKKGSLEGRRPV